MAAETRARVLTELDQTEDAQAAWQALVQATTEGSSTQTRALRGRADLLLGDDQPAAALAVYEEALASAVEPAEAGWSRLGIANAHRMLGRDDEAAGIFDELTTLSLIHISEPTRPY